MSRLVRAAVVLAILAPAVPASAADRSRTDPGPVALFSAPSIAGPVRAGPPTRPVSTSRSRATAGSSLHFDAIPRIGPNWPADPSGAIGTRSIVTAVNVSVAVYDRTGTPLYGPAPFRDLGTFLPGTETFDPKVVYDQYAGEFVLAYLAVNQSLSRSWIVVAAIPDATADDPATWCVHQLKGDQVAGNGPQWADYPGVGYDLDRVAVTTNQFGLSGGGGFEYAQILSFPKASLYDCARTLAFQVFARSATADPHGTRSFTIQPATAAGATPTDQYFVSYERSRLVRSALVLWRLRQTATGPRLSRTLLRVPMARIAPYGTQRGGGLHNPNSWWDPGDLRLVNAFYDGDLGRLYTAHTIFRDLGPDAVTGHYDEAVVRWYEVGVGHPLSASAVTRKGIVGQAETDAGWPAVATDGSGNIVVTFSRASAVTGEFLSAYVAEIEPGSTSPSLTLVAPGTARMEALPGPERWGDFNGIARDPKDPSRVAVVNAYAKADASGTTRDWQETFDLVHQA